MKGKPSTVDPAPLHIVRTRIDGGESKLKSHPVGPTSHFELPPDWIVEEKPRFSSDRIDKYYIESRTGKKFRSVPAVEQYLTDISSSPTKLIKQSPEKRSDKNHDMRIVPSTPGSSDFELPDGWVVEAHKRANSSTIDKYYIETETGKKFRSVLAVKRYLNEAGYESVNDTEPELGKRSSHSAKLAVKRQLDESSNESVVEIRAPRSTNCSPNFVLPHDWVIKTHRRRSGLSSHVTDKYYIEPETGQQFRSLVSVERYLNEKEKEDDEYSMRLKDFKRPNKLRVKRRSDSKSTDASEETHHPESSDGLPTKSEENTATPKEEVVPDHDSGPPEHSDTPKKEDAAEESEAPKDGFGSPPSTLNWVLAGPAGDTWNPYLDEFVVPESTKQKWSETFISSLNDADK